MDVSRPMLKTSLLFAPVIHPSAHLCVWLCGGRNGPEPLPPWLSSVKLDSPKFSWLLWVAAQGQLGNGRCGGWVGAGPDSDKNPSWALDVSPRRGAVLHGKSFFVHTKGGKEAANYLFNPQIIFLRHGRQMLGALCLLFSIRHQGAGGTLPTWVSCCYEKDKETRLGGHEKWQPLPVNMPLLCRRHSKGDHFHCSPSKETFLQSEWWGTKAEC